MERWDLSGTPAHAAGWASLGAAAWSAGASWWVPG